MNSIQLTTKIKLTGLVVAIAMAAVLVWTPPTFSHGGKSHGGTNFSSFQAAQKAIGLYDRLITLGKLPETWETELSSIVVKTRQDSGELEYVVQFIRSDGDPSSVYFFFDQKGAYSGSNFTGN